ncbi:hypothetical protein [Shewanella algidipiscicola]|uniref:MSHA biogenesis protein MshF n=1 Tax=Shewanella algidipiscicola TaxID=614070 RepID=A0ABQ4P850_9GAMM|nr:hypothetical protein [Shewanella algidipiscicola]GIU43636.1 MSHA biogenesis protein MshF [Shewanella algidipiscicola]
MQRQQLADSELIQLYGKIIAIVVVLIILTVLAFRFMGGVEQVSSQGLKVEHTRLVNVLAMVRSQWLSQGRPDSLLLNWSTGEASPSVKLEPLLLNRQGLPTLKHADEAGCWQLWLQLLGPKPNRVDVIVVTTDNGPACEYVSGNGDKLSYQLNSGRVSWRNND